MWLVMGQRTRFSTEYVSIPNVTENPVGDIVQTNDTKEIVKIVKIENGRYSVEPVSPSEKKLWPEMKTNKDGEPNG